LKIIQNFQIEKLGPKRFMDSAVRSSNSIPRTKTVSFSENGFCKEFIQLTQRRGPWDSTQQPLEVELTYQATNLDTLVMLLMRMLILTLTTKIKY